jgi:predicted metal-dependent phosphoesterase TrpH
MDPFDLVRRARDIGLDGVVITEHDWLWTEEELEELRAVAGYLIVLAGVEVTTVEGHFLAYGVRDPFAISRGIGVAELCTEMHRQGGAVVAAHPFRWGQPFDEILCDVQPALDGLEVMSNNMDVLCRQRAEEIRGKYPLTAIGSSDAHDVDVLGVCYTDFAARIRSSTDLVAAIRSRRTTAYDRRESVLV